MSSSYSIFIKKNKNTIFFLLTCLLVQIGINAIFPYLTKIIVDNVLIKEDLYILKIIVPFVVLLFIIQIPINILISYLGSKWSQSISADLRLELSDLFLKEKKYLKDNGLFINTIMSDCDIIGNQVLILGMNIVPNILIIIVYIALLFSLSVKLTMISLVIIPLFITLSIFTAKKVSQLTKKIQKNRDYLLQFLNEYVKNKLLIDIYKLNEEKAKKYLQVVMRIKSTNIYSNTLISTLTSFSGFLTIVAPLMSLFIGSIFVVQKTMSIGTLIAFNSYISLLFNPLSKLLNIPPLYSQMNVSMTRISEIQEVLKSDEDTQSNYQNEEMNDTMLIISDFNPLINGNKLLVDNINLVVARGEFIQVIGENGVGKSIFLKSLINYHTQYLGHITKNIRYNISYIPQENFVFSGSILSNMTKGLQQWDRNKLEDYIIALNFDANLETRVTPFCNELSTGQLQKIKVIRALLSDSEIIILDEILSNLDYESSKKILQILKDENKTVFIVSHGKNNSLADDYNLLIKKIFLN